jgi:serpin B
VSSARPRSVPRLPSPGNIEVTETEKAFFAAELSRLGLMVYRELARSPGSLAVSPLEIGILLATVQGGTEGRTAKRLDQKLGWRGSGERARATYAALLGGAMRVGYTYGLGLFTSAELSAAYTREVVSRLGAEIHTLPTQSEERQKSVLDWLGEGEPSPAGGLGSALGLPRVFLVVGRASVERTWMHAFAPARTRPVPFGSSGRELATMTGTVTVPVAHLPALKVVELPYRDPWLVCDLLLPEGDSGLPALERDLTPERLKSWLDATQMQTVELSLPRFSLKSSFSLESPLTRLGLGDLFAPDARLGAMSRQKGIRLSGLVHQAGLSVDERGSGGTEVTNPKVRPKPAKTPGTSPVVAMDRPFLLVVRDVLAGTMLLVVRVDEETGR